MGTRELSISGFRNIAPQGRGPETLLLNRDLSRDRIGGIVLLIGSNNSGKSNVLDAIDKAVNGGFRKEDVNDFVMKAPNPELRWSIDGDKYRLPDVTEEESAQAEETEKGFVGKLVKRIKKVADEVTDTSIDVSPDTSFDEDSFENDYGYRLHNRAEFYHRRKIKQKDLKCHPDSPNGFFKDLFDVLEIDPDEISDVCDTPGKHRVEMEKRINDSLRGMSDDINDMLGVEGKRYSFRIRIEKTSMELSVDVGSAALNLDRQSEGFRWMFDFYFGVMFRNRDEPGTIILIDEYGDRLNFATLRSLTSRLRAIAKRKALTFVFATQNPMAIDARHLDEVRLVVPNGEGASSIVNDFERFGSKDSEVAKGIIDGLLVSRNYLRKGTRRTVFTEDPRASVLLNAFSSIFSESSETDVDYIPIGAVADMELDPESAVDVMRSIDSSPTVLAESEDSELYRVASEAKMHPFTLDEIFGKGMTIEQLFSENDRATHSIGDMSVSDAVSLSQWIDGNEDSLDDDTWSNFTMVVDYVSLG